MRFRPNGRALGVGTIAVALLAAPLLPTAQAVPTTSPVVPGTSSMSDDADALADARSGEGRLTSQMRDEIDRVLGEPETQRRGRGTFGGSERAQCATFESERYCLGTGWTEASEDEVTARLHRPRGRLVPRESTGDLDAEALKAQRRSMSASARERADRRELIAAARSVAKVKLLRHQILGEPISRAFLARHPEIKTRDGQPTGRVLGRSGGAVRAKAATPRFPEKSTVMNEKRVSEQTRTYWCGPATMQMIGWNWTKKKEPQYVWAKRLGTTTSGSAITELVRVTNARTGWDNADRAGKYITLDISGFRYANWFMLVKKHVAKYRAPMIFHPVLLKRYYPYLDDDASGHFQAGRGYDKNGKGVDKVGYFEPWNQQRFDRSEPHIDRVQWRSAYRSYRANKAHFQHNIGV